MRHITQIVAASSALLVASCATGKGPHEVKLWVEDNDIGIAPESRRKIFDIFYTFHLHEKQSGTGIGLPLAKKALEKMQGSVGMESEVGQGSPFWLALKPIPAGAS